MNDLIVTKKSKFMKQSETIPLRSFFEQIHLMTVISSHISVPHQNILYHIGGQFIPVFLS